MTVPVAPDSFGDTLTAVAAADCIAEGWLAARSQDSVLLAPQSDGGPGFVDVLASRLGTVYTTRVPGPLGAGVAARWLLHDDPDGAASGLTTAYLECAQCCGLHQLGGTPTPHTALAAEILGKRVTMKRRSQTTFCVLCIKSQSVLIVYYWQQLLLSSYVQ